MREAYREVYLAKMNRRTWLRRSSAGLVGLIGAEKLKAGAVLVGSDIGETVVLPHPQFIRFGGRRVSLGEGSKLSVSVEAAPEAGPEAAAAARLIARQLAERTGQSEASFLRGRGFFRIRMRALHGPGKETEVEGGYRLRVGPHGVEIESRGIGFQYAAATFAQLLEQGTRRLPEVEIRDWPSFPFRGIYVEVSSGACMTLQDWKGLIDQASALKLNGISVGLYNCWARPAEVLDTEYFLFPSRHYPQFQTPVRTFVRGPSGWEEQRALPIMVREDFFGKVVSYGKARGVEVSPYFSSLGHNTLIPRLMPEISMKDAQCRPIGYGFCTTCPKTYEVLFSLYDEIIARYARPYGVKTFCVAMDEVAHSCQCPTCRVAWNGEHNFYVNHLLKIAHHLKEQGMTRVLIWHDMLHRSGLLNRKLERRLAAEGLAGLITIGWWYYGAPREGYFNPHSSFGRGFFRPRIGEDYWAVPSAGWNVTGMLAGSDWTANHALVRLIRQGKTRGAKGVISYSNHDPMFEQGYVNLSQYAWNAAPALETTQERYARWLFGGDAKRGAQAMKAYQKVFGVYEGLVGAFYRRPAPPPLGKALATKSASEGAASAPRVRATGAPGFEKARFEESLQSLANAAATLQKIEARVKERAKAQIVASYQAEIRRLGSFLRLALRILECTAAYDGFRSARDTAALEDFASSIQALRQSQEEHAKILLELEDVRFTPSLPRFIPYEQKALKDAAQFVNIFSEMEQRARRGETSFMPEIVIADENFFATHLGMTLP